MSKTYEDGERIDIDALIKAVRKLAAERPDFVYNPNHGAASGPTCLYTLPDGTPDCIIGCAMAEIGQPLPPQGPEGDNDCHLLNDAVGGWSTAFDVEYDDVRVRWLSKVQRRQDSEVPWGEAVKIADRMFPLNV